jgi:hypothetical protein
MVAVRVDWVRLQPKDEGSCDRAALEFRLLECVGQVALRYGKVSAPSSPQPCEHMLVMKNGVFWDVTPCDSCKNRRFGGT